MKYRKKPVVIEAYQYIGKDSIEKMPIEFQQAIKNSPAMMGVSKFGNPFFHIKTLEGKMDITEGDWIIKGVAGEFYPCKPEIFEKSYEEASE